MKTTQFKCLFLFLLIFTQSSKSHCQSNDFIISKLTIKDGLPSNIIWNAEWSKNDNLWLSTQAGLIEYNGNKIIRTRYSHQFIDIQKDIHGNLRALDKFGDIYIINDSNGPEVTKYYSNPSIPKNCFYNFSQFTLNKKYIAKIQNLDTLDFLCFNNKIIQIDDNYFIKNHNDKDFHSYIFKNDELHLISSIYLNKNETIFIINKRIYKVEKNYIFEINGKFQKIKFIGKFTKNINSEKTWFCRNSGQSINYIDGKEIINLSIENGKIITKTVAKTENDQIIKNIIYNNKLSICIITTEANGIYIFKEKKLNVLKTLNKTKTNSFYIQIPISNKQILTTEFGIIGVGEIKKSKKFLTTIDKNWVEDWNQRIWYSGEDIVSYLDKKTLKSEIFKVKKDGGGHWSFLVDRGKKTIYAYNSKGLYGIDSNYTLHCFYNIETKFNPNNQPTVLKIFNNKLFICTNNGIIIYDLSLGKIEKHILPGESIREIYKIKNKYIVCSYGQCIKILNDKYHVTAKKIDRQNYLKFIHAIYIDSNKRVWISTNHGIIYGSEKLLLSLIQNIDFSKYAHYINYHNGLDEIELNGGGNSSIIKFNELLSFTSTNGIVQLNPKDWDLNKDNYNYYLKFTDDDQKEINLIDNQINLDYTNEFCVVEIISTNWNTTSDNRYQYYWEGKWHWLNIENNQKLTLKTKEHGNFPFILIKYLGDGNKHIIKKMSINVALKWSETWWGIGLIILCLGLLIFVIIKIRLRRIRKINSDLNETVKLQTQELLEINKELELRNEKKSQIIAILGHDLFVPLKFLSQTGNAMIKNYSSMAPEEIVDALTSISNTSNRLSLLCRNILNWIQYEKNELELSNQKFELNEVIDQMIQIISIATTQKGNIIIKSMPAKKIINTNLDALGIVILNLLNNANRFSDHSRIFVTCDEDSQNRLVIKIKDEGVGMTEEIREILLQSGSPKTQPDTDHQKSSGIGYYIIHEILKSVNGTIQISEPKTQAGTEIIITWPLQ